MNRVVKILMERDKLDRHLAENRVKEVKKLIADSSLDYNEVEDIIQSELGLEMDYIIDLI